MAKKQKSFAEKASSKGAKDLVHVKFVKSVPSERDGFWRFNESMISMEKGQNLDAKLKEIEDEAKLVDIDMPSENDEQKDSEALEPSSTVEAAVEEVAEETPAEEAAEETPAEEAAEETPAEEVPSEEVAEEAAEETPAEKVAEETPAEEVPSEEVAEEVTEETPVEAAAEEAPAEEVVKEEKEK